MQTIIPLLQNVRVASPCDASWEGMETVDGERVKFCLHCAKNVYNLSEMTQAEAEGLLRKHEGRLCVRYYQRRDGTILTRDCPVGAQAIRMALIRRSTIAASLFILLFGAMAAMVVSERSATGVVGRAPMPVPVAGGITPQTSVSTPPVTQEPEPTMGLVAVPVMGDVAPIRMGKIAVKHDPPVRAVQGHIARPEGISGDLATIPDKPHDFDEKAVKDSTDEAILKPRK